LFRGPGGGFLTVAQAAVAERASRLAGHARAGADIQRRAKKAEARARSVA
jgi:hypothetical protein